MDDIDAIVSPRIDDPTIQVVRGARVRQCAQCLADVWVAPSTFATFKGKLRGKFVLSMAMRDVPVAFWDERLSTAAVTREMIAHDMTRKRRAEIVDRVAAAYILQGFLDAMGRT